MQIKTGAFVTSLTCIAFLFCVFVYFHGESDIAIHWNALGEVDGYAPRYVLWLIPLLITAFDWLFLLCKRWDPKRGNYEKFSSSFATLRRSIAMMLFGFCLITALEAYHPESIHIQQVMPFFTGIMICLLGNIMPRIRPNYFIGIRNPWTLHNDSVWRYTHRICGRLWFFGGILICLCALLPHTIPCILTIIFSIIAIPNIYAYRRYHKQSST